MLSNIKNSVPSKRVLRKNKGYSSGSLANPCLMSSVIRNLVLTPSIVSQTLRPADGSLLLGASDKGFGIFAD